MADTISQKQRSDIMRQIKGKNSKPELIVRKYLHGKGLRYRLHVKDLPGNPDIVLKKYKTVVFIHGCFWHQHPGCKHAHTPKSNTSYWATKLSRNITRDKKHLHALESLGWNVLIVWECEISSDYLADIHHKITNLLS